MVTAAAVETVSTLMAVLATIAIVVLDDLATATVTAFATMIAIVKETAMIAASFENTVWTAGLMRMTTPATESVDILTKMLLAETTGVTLTDVATRVVPAVMITGLMLDLTMSTIMKRAFVTDVPSATAVRTIVWTDTLAAHVTSAATAVRGVHGTRRLIMVEGQTSGVVMTGAGVELVPALGPVQALQEGLRGTPRVDRLFNAPSHQGLHGGKTVLIKGTIEKLVQAMDVRLLQCRARVKEMMIRRNMVRYPKLLSQWRLWTE